MPSTNLLNRVQADHQDLSFTDSGEFRWSPSTRTVHVDLLNNHAPLFLLHELAHAILHHQSYSQDIHLLQLERDAWQLVVNELAERYHVAIDETVIQDNLETYREWLHARSLCPSCTMTGIQSLHGGAYTCFACGCRWKSNEARTCALRRTQVT